MFVITGAEIDQIKKNYVESQSRRSSKLKGLGDELQGVHKIMFDNIDAVLQRGELISGKLRYRNREYFVVKIFSDSQACVKIEHAKIHAQY